MIFPSEYLIDYVRVYQRKDEVNIGCDPSDFPTAKYINDHLEAYMGELYLNLVFSWLFFMTFFFLDVNMTMWQWAKPVNQLYNGQC